MAEAKKPAKVAKFDEEEDSLGGNYKETDTQSQAALEKIVTIQQEIDKLNELASEEILHVEQKYNQLRKPHYQKRAELAQQIPEFWSTTVSFNKYVNVQLNVIKDSHLEESIINDNILMLISRTCNL